MHILLVEDNDLFQQLITICLKDTGYTIDVANNGVEAIEAVGGKEYDLIFMDSMMPIMDGITATMAIRENETDGQRVPIIAFSADCDKGDQQRYLQAGMDDCLCKPTSKVVLLETISRWLKSEQ